MIIVFSIIFFKLSTTFFNRKFLTQKISKKSKFQEKFCFKKLGVKKIQNVVLKNPKICVKKFCVKKLKHCVKTITCLKKFDPLNDFSVRRYSYH